MSVPLKKLCRKYFNFSLRSPSYTEPLVVCDSEAYSIYSFTMFLRLLLLQNIFLRLFSYFFATYKSLINISINIIEWDRERNKTKVILGLIQVLILHFVVEMNIRHSKDTVIICIVWNTMMSQRICHSNQAVLLKYIK